MSAGKNFEPMGILEADRKYKGGALTIGKPTILEVIQMKVSDLMTVKAVSIEQNESVSAAARLLKSHNIGSIPVCDTAGKLRGMVTDRDIVMRCVADGSDPHETRVSEIMSRGIITANPFDELDDAVKLMSDDQVRRLPVVEEGRLVGMLSLCDMARSASCEMEAAEALSEISSNFKRRK